MKIEDAAVCFVLSSRELAQIQCTNYSWIIFILLRDIVEIMFAFTEKKVLCETLLSKMRKVISKCA